eukprot:3039947-Amphidinium_carterae.5
MDRIGLFGLDESPRDSDETGYVLRARELALQNITEINAKKRVQAADKSRSTIAGEELNLKAGDQVEFWTKPSNKDVSGWKGPALVVDITRLAHGTVGLNWQG